MVCACVCVCLFVWVWVGGGVGGGVFVFVCLGVGGWWCGCGCVCLVVWVCVWGGGGGGLGLCVCVWGGGDGPFHGLLTSPVAVSQNSGPVDEDPLQNCARCGTKVYFAEELASLGRKWHKACFKCGQWRQKLDIGPFYKSRT